MQGLENDHVPADRGKRVDGLDEVVLVLLGARHLRQRMEELVVDVEKPLLRRRQVIEGKGPHRPDFIAVEGLVAGSIGVVAEVAAAVLDHHPGFPVNPHELRFAGIALAGLQDQGGLETQRHTLFGEVRLEVRILDAGEEPALVMADELHRRRGDERHVVDRLPGRAGECRPPRTQILHPQRRGVGKAERAAEESVVLLSV